ncbi:glycoside hydrolase family 65 protein [Pseudohyphozyma bogoriensis]|nr:glycoside hydrolase family 65 protein [Pseudohyphozyma bogoriensis]
MGATTIRSTTLGVSVGTSLSVVPSLGVVNQEALEAIDWAIWAAKSYGMRLILPLTDQYDYYHGGIPTFLRFHNLSDTNFDPFYDLTSDVYSTFKSYISTLITHRSTITNLTMAEEPTILAFETGNELGGWGLSNYPPPVEWTTAVANYLKELAPNTLVMSGSYGVRSEELGIADVDLYSDHFYPPYAYNLKKAASLTKSHDKVFIVGEFDWTNRYFSPAWYALVAIPVVLVGIMWVLPAKWWPWRISLGCGLVYLFLPTPISTFLSTLESLSPTSLATSSGSPTEVGVSGSLYWSLFGRTNSCCAFVDHNDGYTLHYPSNPTSASSVTGNPSAVVELSRHAWRMRGYDKPTWAGENGTKWSGWNVESLEVVQCPQNALSVGNSTTWIGNYTALGVSYDLSSTNFNRTSFSVQPYVANGYIGQRIPVEGFGYTEITPVGPNDGTNGWPLFDKRFTAAMVAGFYDQQAETNGTNFAQTGGEQPISTIPTWSSIYLTLNGSTYSNSTPTSEISNWTQSMSIQDGIVKTSLTWTPTGGSPVSLLFTIFAHRTMPNLGVVRLDVEGLAAGANLSFTDVLDGAGSWRTTPVAAGVLKNYTNTIYSAVSPNGISNVTAYIASVGVVYPLASPVTTSPACLSINTNPATASQCYSLTASETGTASFTKYVGIASSDAYGVSAPATAIHWARHGNLTGYTDIAAEHSEAWNALWEESDILIPGDDELQLATRASLFHILSNVRQGNESTGLGDNSIAPAGLTSDSYAGQIFWDADLWMYPSLLALFPSYAESIVNFRYRQLGAAQENAKQYNVSGAIYPWTGGRFGNCTGVGPCYDYEYHLNNDIVLAHYQYYAATGNKTWLQEKGWPVISSIAEFWESFVVYNSTTGGYDTLNETDPDEYANFKNNAAFTNAGIQVILRQAIALAAEIGESVPGNWSAIADKITIFQVLMSSTTSDGFNGTTDVKQADVVLLTYPLEYNQTKTQAIADLDYYAGATSPNGPGMTYSIFSIDASAISPMGCASYTYMLGASQPYSRAPFYQFSEQTTDTYDTNGGTNPAFTFLTGHGGFLQSFTHGFTGYRSRLNSLYLDPILPVQLTNYTIRGLDWQGSLFDVSLATESTTVTRRSGSGNVTVEIGSSNSKAGNYSLAVGESLTVPTRSTTGTLIEGNLAQCATSLNDDTGFSIVDPQIVPGQYALSAIDGSNSTVWQPLTNASATMSVDLGAEKTIKGFHFNWGSVPPTSYSVAAGTDLANLTVVSSASVNISAPYNATFDNEVTTKIGNLTNVSLSTQLTARYVNLTIAGSFVDDGEGGTVAEFAVL